MRIFCAICFHIILAIAVTAYAGQGCDDPQKAWKCFGTIEFKYQNTHPQLAGKNENANAKIRMHRFENKEFMAELESSDNIKKYINALPSGVQLYWGLADNESAMPSGKNPFNFLEYTLYLPLRSLHTAFPAGPTSVPNGELETKILFQNKHPFTVKTNRIDSQKIVFSINGTLKETKGSVDYEVSGLWNAQSPLPLPNLMPLTGWKHAESRVFQNLGEARSVNKKLK